MGPCQAAPAPPDRVGLVVDLSFCGGTFRRVLVRYEFIADVHYAFKTLAYTMINLRHFCRS
jgi:hypothetical protein